MFQLLRRVLIISAFTFSILPAKKAFCQIDTTRVLKGYLVTDWGIQVPEYRNLNHVLTSINYPEVSPTSTEIGISLLLKKRRLTLQTGFGFFSPTASNTIQTVSLRNQCVQAVAGYCFREGKKLQFNTGAGYGIIESSVRLFQSQNTLPFSAYSMGSARISSVYTLSSGFIAAAQVNYFIHMDNSPKGRNWCFLGIRASYYLPVTDTRWMVGGAPTDGPRINPGGFGSVIVFGFTI